MATDVFNTGNVIYQSDSVSKQQPVSAYTELYLDGGQPVSFCMVQQSGGKQNARINIQATLNGDFYAVGGTPGLGLYEMLFIDGIKTGDCTEIGNSDSILAKYLSIKDIKARQAVVKIYAPTGTATSKACGTFKGLVHGMSTRLVEEQEGNLLLYVGLSVLGSWSE